MSHKFSPLFELLKYGGGTCDYVVLPTRPVHNHSPFMFPLVFLRVGGLGLVLLV